MNPEQAQNLDLNNTTHCSLNRSKLGFALYSSTWKTLTVLRGKFLEVHIYIVGYAIVSRLKGSSCASKQLDNQLNNTHCQMILQYLVDNPSVNLLNLVLDLIGR